MKRRLVVSFLGVTTVVLLLLAIPTAYLLQSVANDETKALMERQGTALLTRLADRRDPPDPGELESLIPEDVAAQISLADGTRLTIHVVPTANVVTTTAFDRDGGRAVMSTSDAPIRERIRRAMVVLLGLGVAGLLATWLLAQAEARRLGTPLEQLAQAADRLGSGDFSVVAPRSGIPELDALAITLDASAARIGALVAAERQFNTDASHQLRSALTGLRLRLESLTLTDDPEAAADAQAALEQADRLTATVDDLLRLSRTGRAGISTRFDLRALVASHATDAAVVLGRSRRRLVAPGGAPVEVVGAPGAVGQALDVLLANATKHGRGTVTVSIVPSDVWVELRVGDEGSIRLDADELFLERSRTDTHGIGLRLARRLIESEGGSLDLASTSPTVFRIRLPLEDSADPAEETTTPPARRGPAG